MSRLTRARNTTQRSNEERSYPASLLADHLRQGLACFLSQLRVGLLMHVGGLPQVVLHASASTFLRA